MSKRGSKEKNRSEGDGAIRFTYSTSDQPLLQRTVIQAIEKIGGQARLKKLYDRRNDDRQPGESFFGTALRLLKINVEIDRAALALCPVEGPVVFIANHPYGVLDGISLTWASMLVRPDTRVLANSVLCQIPEARDNLLPVDFAGTREARETNVRSRLAAQSWLRAGHAIGIFPGGGVSTSERPHKGPAVELPWAPFTAKLIRASRATIIPVFFVGQNSRLFQLASHVSDTLRLSLVFRETARRIGTRLTLRVGRPIPFSEISHIEDRAELVKELRRRTFALAAPGDIKGAKPLIETRSRFAPPLVSRPYNAPMQTSRDIWSFISGTAVGTLGGLIGLGGAEFRLPLLISLFRFPALEAVILNKAMSLVVVATALPFRAAAVPFDVIAAHWMTVVNLLAGSLVGAWFGASWATRLSSQTLFRIIAVLLVVMAVALVWGHDLDGGQALLAGPAQIIAGMAAGFAIGVVASLMGVAGGELLIPTLMLLFGADIKLAGSLSLAVSLPTMLVGFARYSRDSSFAVIGRHWPFVVTMALGSIAGTFIGGQLLGFVPSTFLLPILALILIASAIKIWRHQ